MELTIGREDMRPGYQETNCSQTKFEHFNDQVQRVIKAVGRAMFYEYDRTNYNTIYPPGEGMRQYGDIR